MPLPSYTLYAPEASFRAFGTLIAAEYNGVTVKADTTNGAAASKSPVGKLPVLELSDGTCVFSSQASARYIASLRRDSGLLGASLQEAGAIDAWMDWASADLELPACVWFYPVAGYMPFNQASYEKAKTDLGNALKILDAHLMTKTYLVNDQVTLADIVVASTLLYPMKLVCDKAFLKPYANVVRWFQTCVNQPEFAQVVGTVAMCKKEMTAAGQAAPAAAAKGGGGKKAAKKEKAAAPAPAPAPVKKVEHPFKIMDKEHPSKFSMDAWKKTYSNAKTCEEAMTTFWETFDSEGWTLWHQTYDYNEDNKRIFMSSNAIGGFHQRTDEIRKWCFAVQDVLGTEGSLIEIPGIWLIRGHSIEEMKQANDDANWYSWKALTQKGQPVSDETKKIVTDFWCNENEIDGKPIQDSKVFK